MYFVLFAFLVFTSVGTTLHIIEGNVFQAILGFAYMALIGTTYHLGRKQDATWFSNMDFPIWFQAGVAYPVLFLTGLNTFILTYTNDVSGIPSWISYFFVFIIAVTLISGYYKIIRGNKHD